MTYTKEPQQVDNYMKKKTPLREVCGLKEMSKSFAQAAEELGVYMTINPSNLAIESVHYTTKEGLARLMLALDTAYVELMHSDDEVDNIIPLVLIVEDYFKALRKASRRKGGASRLN